MWTKLIEANVDSSWARILEWKTKLHLLFLTDLSDFETWLSTLQSCVRELARLHSASNLSHAYDDTFITTELLIRLRHLEELDVTLKIFGTSKSVPTSSSVISAIRTIISEESAHDEHALKAVVTSKKKNRKKKKNSGDPPPAPTGQAPTSTSTSNQGATCQFCVDAGRAGRHSSANCFWLHPCTNCKNPGHSATTCRHLEKKDERAGSAVVDTDDANEDLIWHYSTSLFVDNDAVADGVLFPVVSRSKGLRLFHAITAKELLINYRDIPESDRRTVLCANGGQLKTQGIGDLPIRVHGKLV
ncbi:hypothetical protein HDU67_004999, partial [Dinochytrium kinnereticum]